MTLQEDQERFEAAWAEFVRTLKVGLRPLAQRIATVLNRITR